MQRYNNPTSNYHYSSNNDNYNNHYTGIGMNYSGPLRTTKSGRTCQRWAKKRPHAHSYAKYADRYPEGSAAASENYCRNPAKNFDGVWCYTTDKKKRWELCDVQKCKDTTTPPPTTTTTAPFEDMGCWRNKIVQQLDLLERTDARLDKFNYKKRSDAINKCADVATDAGYDFFAVGNNGQCWGGHGDTYQHYGQPNKCPPGGKGKYAVVNVYKINK